MTCDVQAARRYILANGRRLDQHLTAVVLDRRHPEFVVRALSAYRNDDGGFGHGLEPDKRVPASQRLDVEIAFEYLINAGATAPDLITRRFGTG